MHNEQLVKFKEICSLTRSHRTASDLEFLSNIAKSIRVYKNLMETHGFQVLQNVSQFFSFETARANEYIFRYGDPPDKFYSILEGKASIQIPTDDTLENFFELMSIETGASFGEAALEYNRPRAGSVQCTETTHMIVLDKKHYLNYMRQIVYENKQDMIDFLKELPVFSGFTNMLLAKVTYSMKEKTFLKGQKI